jgi:hypothetical protein
MKSWWIAFPDGRKFNLDEAELLRGVESGQFPGWIQGSYQGGPYVPISQSPAVQAVLQRKNAVEAEASAKHNRHRLYVIGAVVGTFVVIPCGLAFLQNLGVSKRPPVEAAQPEISQKAETKAPLLEFEIKQTKEFKEGYKIGYDLGQNHGRLKYGYPTDDGFILMSRGRNTDAGRTGDRAQWFSMGIRAGFDAGYTKKGGVVPNMNEFEPLSWGNARPGVVLFNGAEPDATIVSVQKSQGLITVRYKQSGAIEQKDLEAVSRFWNVKKQ